MKSPIILIASGLIAGLAIFAIAILQPWLSYEYFFSDISSIAHVNPLYGIASTLLAMMWFGCSMVCFFCATLLKDSSKNFLLSSFGLTALLSLDEMLRFHDYISPSLLGFGEREPKMILVTLTLLYLWIFRKIIARSGWMILAVSGMFFVLSLLIDNRFTRHHLIFPTFPRITTESHIEILEFLVEDTLKTTGVFLWILFHFDTARRLIREQFQSKKSSVSVLEYPPSTYQKSQLKTTAKSHQNVSA